MQHSACQRKGGIELRILRKTFAPHEPRAQALRHVGRHTWACDGPALAPSAVMKLTKIVVGIDGSPRSADVLGAARELAERSHAQLILVHAVSVPAGIAPEYYVYPPEQMP